MHHHAALLSRSRFIQHLLFSPVLFFLMLQSCGILVLVLLRGPKARKSNACKALDALSRPLKFGQNGSPTNFYPRK
jgi:hypothetical protein